MIGALPFAQDEEDEEMPFVVPVTSSFDSPPSMKSRISLSPTSNIQLPTSDAPVTSSPSAEAAAAAATGTAASDDNDNKPSGEKGDVTAENAAEEFGGHSDTKEAGGAVDCEVGGGDGNNEVTTSTATDDGAEKMKERKDSDA